MNRKQLVVLVLVGVAVIVGIVIGVFSRKGGPPPSEPSGAPIAGEETGEPEVQAPVVPEFSPETPKNAEPTKPTAAESPAAPGAEEKFGAFNMTVSSAGFNPNSITVRKGDAVQIRLTAVGGDYDFDMPYKGLYVMVPEGETKQITFGINTAGSYGFMCRDFCPQGRTISGTLIVLP
ncbi:MAG: cupredoxin domain-containing protein [Candidatus Brennerbacteria bacterium]|nr:cupredoxin domain-containing protein [Candidatus Brennerbacteria bacterium]